MLRQPVEVASVEEPGVPFGTACLPELAMGVDLAAAGYIEREFFLAGSAMAWTHDENSATKPATAGVPFRTRVLVRSAVDPTRSSGFVQVEPLHPDLDSALTWNGIYPWLLRGGHSWMGVTVFADVAGQLTEIDPERYRSLDIPIAGLQYEIMSAAVRALHDGKLGPTPVDRVVMSGMSATGSFCRVFLQDGFHERLRADDGRPLVDGYVIGISSGGAGAAGYPPLSDDDPGLGDADSRRTVTGHGVVAFEVLSETESETHDSVMRDDSDDPTDRYRLYQIAGTAHIEARQSVLTNLQQFEQAGGSRPAFSVRETRSDARFDVYLRAAFEAMLAWIVDGIPAPRGARLELRDGTEQLERDEDGNVRGGIRSPWITVPTASYHPHATASDECEPPPEWMPFSRPDMLARLVGAMTPFPLSEIRRRYGTRAGFLERFAAATTEQLSQRFLLADDARELLRDAPERWRG